jgi:acyl-CoA thioesterase-1
MPLQLATRRSALPIPIPAGPSARRPRGLSLATAAPIALLALLAPPAFAAPVAAPAPSPSVAPPLVVFLGDSLTAGLGVAADQAYPALLEKALRADGIPVRVLNAGVSGDTTAGGLRRLPWLLAQHPAVVAVGLGANDGLRAQPVAEIDRNLRQIVARIRAAGAEVLLLGMQIPPNYGPDYAGSFAAIYPRLAHDLRVPLVPFLLAGVGGVPELNQADGVHPTPAGHVKVAATVKPYLEALLRQDAAHTARPAAAAGKAGASRP